MRVLIVDDERHIRDSLKKYLGLEHIDAEGAETGEAALEALGREPFDAVVLDLKLPGISGQEVLERMLRQGLPTPAIMISAHGQIADAVAALKAGARDYLVKPFDPAELVIKLRGLVEDKRRENLVEAEKRTGVGETTLIGETAVMRALSAQIDKIAASNVTVLVSGESGTGKEVVAREIHRRSLLAAEPFVAVNIGGIHEGLMESELFGHEKGAFTGAVARKPGLFELAGRGCLFLDEIGEMPMPLQVKLLRVLQDRKIRRLGGTGDIPVNARIISATNRDPEALVREGRFREDLYYRLNVFRLTLPPLRERSADIPLLARQLLGKLAARMGKPPCTLGAGAEEKLCSYSFPGNVRELENILERALIFCEGNEIQDRDIDLHRETSSSAPFPGTSSKAGTLPLAPGDDPRSLGELEKEAVIAALNRSGGNRTRAAEELGISRKTILNKIKAYGIREY
ncbi:MAG: sigma-54 dependent transcriptional regulator [Spirochaetaceae bacterium]|jgi:two-component system response regulator AtoC|nr:sigma-54 dependent transcriptional regulator [Spirochaetaceae bacterium]